MWSYVNGLKEIRPDDELFPPPKITLSFLEDRMKRKKKKLWFNLRTVKNTRSEIERIDVEIKMIESKYRNFVGDIRSKPTENNSNL